jgi:hypothetical protein
MLSSFEFGGRNVEPGGVFGGCRPGVAGHEVAEVERAFGRFDPTAAVFPTLDARTAGGQFDHARVVAIEDGRHARAGDDAGVVFGHVPLPAPHPRSEDLAQFFLMRDELAHGWQARRSLWRRFRGQRCHGETSLPQYMCVARFV